MRECCWQQKQIERSDARKRRTEGRTPAEMRSKSTARRFAKGVELVDTGDAILADNAPTDTDSLNEMPGSTREEFDIPPVDYTVFQVPKPLADQIDNIDPDEGIAESSRTEVENAFKHSKDDNIQNNRETVDLKDFETAKLGGIRDADIEIKGLPNNQGIGVWTRVRIEAGEMIGPCAGKGMDRGNLNSAKDQTKSDWMTLIRPVTNTEASNLMAVQLQNQLYYRAIREIQAGEEMLLYAKDRLYPQKDIEDYRKMDDELSSFPCSECGEVLKTKSALQTHQAYSCQNSGPVFPEPVTDRQEEHETIRNADGTRSPVDDMDCQEPGEYKCEECPRSFALKSNLARHQITHESGRRFSCEHCERCFTDPSNLQRHIRSQHHGARCHACTDCGKTFATSSGLKQHQHIHSSVKPFQCEVCLKAYTQFSNLCRHKRMHADCRQQIKCNDCGQAFSTITSLSKHKRFCEGALRNGMRLSYSGDAKLSTTAGGIPHVSPTSPFSPALMMGLYGARPPYPFYQPMGSNFAGMFPTGHPLAALSSLSPGNMRSSAFSLTPTKTEMSPSGKFENSSRVQGPSEGSDGGSEFLSGSDLDNIPSDSESEKSYRKLSPETVTVKTEASVVKSKTPELSHSVPAILSQPHPNTFTSRASPRSLNFKTSPPSLTKEEPFDLTKAYKSEHITPKTSPSVEPPTAGEQPLDLSRTKELTPPEAPRKTHVFGEAKTPVTSEQRIHYAYPQFSSPMMMEQVLRMSEKKEKSPESSSFLPYTRFPFTGPSQYPVGVNPFSMVMNREPAKPVQSPAFSPAAKSLESPFQYTSPSQYSSPNKVKDRYACKFCGKIFPRSANLTRHLRTHTGEQPYKCKYCERSFSISSNLQRHVRNIHNKEKPFRCALCDRCFGQQTNLDRHLKKHETDGMNIPDSPENETESVELDDKDESYFAEIRNFIGKATETDINQNSLALKEMKARMNPIVDNSFEDENEAELDVGGPGDMEDAGTDGTDSGENENDNNAYPDEPANKRSRLADQLLINSFTNDTALPLCQKPSFELKRCFSPLICSP